MSDYHGSPDFAELLRDMFTRLEALERTHLGLRVVHGYVSSAGALLIGSAFTPSRAGAGDYTVTFTVPFTSTPVINIGGGETGGGLVAKLHPSTAPSASGFRVTSFISSTVVATDGAFSFWAAGT